MSNVNAVIKLCSIIHVRGWPKNAMDHRNYKVISFGQATKPQKRIDIVPSLSNMNLNRCRCVNQTGVEGGYLISKRSIWFPYEAKLINIPP